jgi:hypothetical protein
LCHSSFIIYHSSFLNNNLKQFKNLFLINLNLKKMKVLKFLSAVLIGSTLVFASCKKDADEQENINVIKLTLGSTTFTWSDTDGAGGKAPVIDTIRLAVNATSAFSVELSDGSASPAKDFTAEVIAEKNDHLFVYTVTGAKLTALALSTDANGKAFGQSGTMTAGTASTGTLQIVLKHLPDKSAANPATTGETDVDVVFPVVIR